MSDESGEAGGEAGGEGEGEGSAAEALNGSSSGGDEALEEWRARLLEVDEHHDGVHELLGHRELDAVELGALHLRLDCLAQIVSAVLEDLVHLAEARSTRRYRR